MIEKQISYIFSSNPANGAKNISADGSEFTVTLYDPIAIPAHAKYCTVEVQGANIWYTSPNISVDLDNNVFAFFDGTANQSITIPKGLYDLSQLAKTIATGFKTVSGAVTDFIGTTAKYVGGKLGIGTLPNQTLSQAFGSEGFAGRLTDSFSKLGDQASNFWNSTTADFADRGIMTVAEKTAADLAAFGNTKAVCEDALKLNDVNWFLQRSSINYYPP